MHEQCHDTALTTFQRSCLLMCTRSPSDTPSREVAQLFTQLGLVRAWRPDSTIVHSTSWRYETDGPVVRTDQLIVTYVIIVQPQPEHAQSLAVPDDSLLQSAQA